MWSDSNDFLWRIDIIKKNNSNTNFSWISKIYIDLLMAIESDLKSLIISLSKKQETPEEAYTIARNRGHSIVQLFEEVEQRAKNRIKLLEEKDKNEIINRASKIKVSNRYKLISFLNIRSELGIDRDIGLGKYSSLLTYQYLEKIEVIALKLHSIAKKSNEKYTPDIAMSGGNMEKYFDRIEEFKNNVRRL